MSFRGRHASRKSDADGRQAVSVDADAAREYFIFGDKGQEIEVKKKIALICDAAEDRKAENIVVMEMGEKSSIGAYFIVMSAASTVRVKAIVDHIETQMEEAGQRVFHKEGLKEAVWVLLDFGEVIVHVFHHETRKFYSLETLWGDAPQKHYHPPSR